MSLTSKLDTLYDAALALVYPRACAVCRTASVEARADSPACEACWEATRVFNESDKLCGKCGALAQGASSPLEISAEVRCRRCEAETFTAARACGVYEGALRAAVLELKREPHVASRLARLLEETYRRAPFETAARIVPVPLHAERERERGFNQASLLGRELAGRTGIAMDEWSLARVTHTSQHRAGMDARSRRESVEAAFQVARPRLVEGVSVLLVDDVFTTGATASACASALRAAGAREVFVLTVARV
jgi:ComF family protein